MNVPLVLLLFGSLIACILLSIPISFSLMLTSLMLIVSFDIVSLSSIPSALYNSIDSFALTAIPFFILAANIMDKGNLMRSIVKVTKNAFRRVRGGLGMALMVTSAVFAAMCGTSVASAAAIGNVGIPMMEEEDYPGDYAAAIIASGGTMGIMIPPSLTMILICSLIGENVSRMFIAGILPGLVQMTLLCIVLGIIASKRKYGKVGLADKPTREEWIRAAFAIMLPIIILGGIYGGIFTPTEAAAVACLYALIVVVFIYRQASFKDIFKIFIDSAKLTGNILFILAGATLFGIVLNYSGLPQQLVRTITTSSMPVWLFYVVSFFIFLLLGMLLDGNAMVAITIPLLWPVVQYYGINPIVYSIFMIACVQLGTLTPPVGMNLFVTSTIARQPLDKVAFQEAPLIGVQIVFIFLIILIPGMSLLLPGLMM